MLCSVRFSESTERPDVTDKVYDRLRKQRALCDVFSDLLTEFYKSSEHLVVEMVTVKFRVWFIFR